MSRKEKILQDAARMKKLDDARAAKAKRDDKPYKPTRVVPFLMPLGCWVWVASFCALAYYGFKQLFG